MANQIIIDIGAVANDGTGDPLRTAFGYVNNNFSNIWTTGVANSNIAFSGNKILTTNTNGNLVLAPNGIGKVQANVDIVPNANNTLNLGSLTNKWNTVYTQYLEIGGTLTTGDLTVDGNLTVSGNIIQIGNLVTDAKTIQLSNTASTANAANGSGITVGANDNIATMLYDSSSNVWTTNIGIVATGNITGTYFIGNGSLLTGIASPYGNSNVAAYLPTYTGNLSGGNLLISSAGNTWTISGKRITGPGGAYWRSNPDQQTDDIVSAPGESLRLQSLNISNVVEGQLSLTGSYAEIFVNNGISRTWRFNESGVTEFPLDITPVVAGGANANIGNVTNPWANAYITGNIVAGNIIPVANNTQSLGNATNQWSDLYVSNATIYMNNVPIGLTAGNVLTVDGEPVLVNDSNTSITTTGNITADTFFGSGVTAAAANDVVSLNAFDTDGNTVSIQAQGNTAAAVIETYSVAGNNRWTWSFGIDGILTVPGNIASDGNIIIDNSNSGVIADISIYSADNILLQGADRTNPGEPEGGDIDIFAGNGAADNGTGGTGGGDVRIEGGLGGTANTFPGGFGGTVDITGGNGGAGSATARASGGGSISITAGNGGTDNGGGGYTGGGVFITAGDSTDSASDRGSIVLASGAGGDETTVGGYVQISIPASGTNPGGQWTFTGTGLTLEPPPNGEIFSPNTGNLTVGTVGNTIIRNIGGVTTYDWVFSDTGNLTAPGNITATDNVTGANLFTAGSVNVAGNVNLTGAEGSDTARIFADVSGSDTSLVLEVGDDNGDDIVLRHYSFAAGTALDMLTAQRVSNTEANVSVAGNFSATGNISGNTAGYAIGYRDIPQVALGANATAAIADAGKHYYSTTAGNLQVTIPDNANVAFPTGATITVVVNAAGNVIVAQGTGVSLYMAGSSTTGNRTVGAYGLASVMKVATDTWVISGTGVY